MKRICLPLALGLLLAACGQQGPLYLPPEEKESLAGAPPTVHRDPAGGQLAFRRAATEVSAAAQRDPTGGRSAGQLVLRRASTEALAAAQRAPAGGRSAGRRAP